MDSKNLDIHVDTKWVKDHEFVANVSGHEIIMSSNYEVGSSPKKMLLASLAGCTGLDVVDMLKKMRVEYDTFDLKVSAHMTDEHPKIYDVINIDYCFSGKSLDQQKIEKAVHLSKEKYCGVSAMLGKVSKINFNITLQNIDA
jgi:putative redox protein